MNDIVSLGGTGRRRRAVVTRWLACAAVIAALISGIVSHLPGGRRAPARTTSATHVPRRDVRINGPVQLAGLGSAAARQLDHARSPTIAR